MEINTPECGISDSLAKKLREGNAVAILPLGIILTSQRMKYREGAIPASREKVIRAIEACLYAQRQKLLHTDVPAEIAEIDQTIASLQADLADPSKYL